MNPTTRNEKFTCRRANWTKIKSNECKKDYVCRYSNPSNHKRFVVRLVCLFVKKAIKIDPIFITYTVLWWTICCQSLIWLDFYRYYNFFALNNCSFVIAWSLIRFERSMLNTVTRYFIDLRWHFCQVMSLDYLNACDF